MTTTDVSPCDVYLAHSPFPAYGMCEHDAVPELAPAARKTTSLVTLRKIMADAGLDAPRFGTGDWNPLGDIIEKGQRVLLKPNLVFHKNHSGQGLDCLITHSDLIEAVLHYVVKAQPDSVIIGDSPIQGCDFEALLDKSGLAELVQRFRTAGTELSIRDFRRVVMSPGRIQHVKHEGARGLQEYVLFDLGSESCLEAITKKDTPFRVTMYEPSAFRRTHGIGMHRYLIAREVVEADVVINMPKLKTHKKAGLTGALKNMVGINGHKEYLPHHRKGNSGAGGDCYGDFSALKMCAEDLLDRANSTKSAVVSLFLSHTSSLMLRLNRMSGGDGDVEGSWCGNDTVWRTCLDLQRILHYGGADGSLGQIPQRKILNITDAIVAGEAEGPLAPEPVPLGIITLGTNAAAVEWVHAILMGLDPHAIPLVRESFSSFRYPLVDFAAESIRVHVDGNIMEMDEIWNRCGRKFRLPLGWQGHCELVSKILRVNK